MHDYQKVTLRFNLDTNNYVKTFVSDEEYESIKSTLTEYKTETAKQTKNNVEVAGKNIYVIIEDFKNRIETDFDNLTDDEREVLALKEFKTRVFQDTIRREFRQSHNLIASTSTVSPDARAIYATAKLANADKQKAMLDFARKYDLENN